MSDINASWYSSMVFKACLQNLPITIDSLVQTDDNYDISDEHKETFQQCVQNFGATHDLVRQAMVDYLNDQPIKGGLDENE